MSDDPTDAAQYKIDSKQLYDWLKDSSQGERDALKRFYDQYKDNPFSKQLDRLFNSPGGAGNTALPQILPRTIPPGTTYRKLQRYFNRNGGQAAQPTGALPPYSNGPTPSSNGGLVIPQSAGKGPRQPQSQTPAQPATRGDSIDHRFEETQARVPDFSALQRNPAVRGSDAYVELRRKRFGEVQFEAFVRNVEPEVAARMLGLRDDEWA